MTPRRLRGSCARAYEERATRRRQGPYHALPPRNILLRQRATTSSKNRTPCCSSMESWLWAMPYRASICRSLREEIGQRRQRSAIETSPSDLVNIRGSAERNRLIAVRANKREPGTFAMIRDKIELSANFFPCKRALRVEPSLVHSFTVSLTHFVVCRSAAPIDTHPNRRCSHTRERTHGNPSIPRDTSTPPIRRSFENLRRRHVTHLSPRWGRDHQRPYSHTQRVAPRGIILWHISVKDLRLPTRHY